MKRMAMALALAMAAQGAGAGPLSDLLMAPGGVAPVAPGTVIARYEHDRALPPPAAGAEGARSPALSDAVVTLAMAENAQGPVLEIARAEGAGEPRPLAAFPAAGPNPVLLYFLEGTVRAMAEATGGSPYYIRNRIREALAAAGPGEPAAGGREALLTPFAADPNRDRMGGFAGLTLRIGYDGPRILRLSADTGGAETGYHDRLRLMED